MAKRCTAIAGENNDFDGECLLPLVAESTAHPAPVAPPPMMSTSKDSDCKDESCSALVGRCLVGFALPRFVSMATN
jgi:hypothetical protein